MKRVLLPTLFAAVACHTSAPLSPGDPQQADAKVAMAPVAGGKGFVAPRATPPVPPMTLTATDGSGLKLVALDADALVDDPVALTELDLTFENARSSQVEGKFEVSLPPGAMITRFAMKIGGAWQEGEVVPRDKGRQVYESFMHERRDPALLEVETGNRFSARVFPIAALGKVEIKLSYLQTFAEPEVAYRIPLRGLPKIESMHLAVRGTAEPVDREASGQRPREDLVAPRKAEANAAWRLGGHAIARVTVPEAFGDEVKPPASIVLLFDTSASRASQFSDKVERLGRLVGALGKRLDAQTKLTVLPFDQAVGSAVFDGTIGGFDEARVSRALVNRRALGASDLAGALRSAGKLRPERIVVVTDGMITAGESDAGTLGKQAEELADAGVQRIDVVAGLDQRDDAVLSALVTADLPQAGVVIDADRSAEEVAMRLLRPTAPTIVVRAPGAKRVWPTELRGVQAGDAVLVFAEVGKRASTLEVELAPVGGEVHTHALKLASTRNPAFDRAFVRADVEQQLRAIADLPTKDRIAKQRRLTKTSVDNRILNDLTALLVLETEGDYARFDIDRKATEDVLTLEEPRAKERQKQKRRGSFGRRVVSVKSGPVQEGGSVGRTISMDEFRNIPVGNTSRDFTQTVESAATAGADSEGTSLAGPRADPGFRGAAPRRGSTKPATATLFFTRARGALSRSRARELARRSMSSVEACYHNALRSHGEIKGKITLELVVDSGRVLDVRATRDTARAPHSLQQCVIAAVQRWRFGAIGDPPTDVRLTFALEPGSLPALPVAAAPRPESPPALPAVPKEVVPASSLDQVYTGKLAEVMRRLAGGQRRRAAEIAWAWRDVAPDDLMALVAVGEVAEAYGNDKLAARIYGSIAELHPSQAPIRRFAAGRLERLERHGLAHAIASFREAKKQRPDHPSSHRGLAWALAHKGDYAAAFEALAAGIEHDYPAGRFLSSEAELGEELGVLAAAWMRKSPSKRATIQARLAELGTTAADQPSLRFVLTWETDANDVDLHVVDKAGNHASYQRPQLDSGGLLLGDVTNGFGPESFVIDGKPDAYPYDLTVHYYRQGPMGFGMGQVQIIRHDGKGNLDIETRPFLAMSEDAWVDLGEVDG